MLAVQLGYAADRSGHGVAYGRLTSRAGERLVRAAFHVARFPGLDGREIAYAALHAVASMLAERGVQDVRFAVADAQLVADVTLHRDVAPPLVLPYVRLGCMLNHFKRFSVTLGEDHDLTTRACAEVALDTAA